MSTTEVFHEGELAVQERAGDLLQGRNSGQMIADAIIPGAIKFVKRQPLAIIGSIDGHNDVWATMLVGRPGFMVAESKSLDLDLSQSVRIADDPLWENIRSNPRIGMLVIDLRTRARLRVNGRAEFLDEDSLHVTVERAYPNCPKYIQRRNYRPSIDSEPNTQFTAATDSQLNSTQQQWITSADTLFVASQHPTAGVDASHRGGNPGFIQILSPSRLRIPDYAGNSMYNTLGNFAANPRAGVTIPDFENGRTLQLTGRPEIAWDVDDPQNETGGTRRYWDFEIDRWIQIDNALSGTSEFLDYSPHNPGSGS